MNNNRDEVEAVYALDCCIFTVFHLKTDTTSLFAFGVIRSIILICFNFCKSSKRREEQFVFMNSLVNERSTKRSQWCGVKILTRGVLYERSWALPNRKFLIFGSLKTQLYQTSSMLMLQNAWFCFECTEMPNLNKLAKIRYII